MFKLLVCVAAGLAVSGCATVTRGTTEQVQITSEPSGADVRTSMGPTCVTPCTLQVAAQMLALQRHEPLAALSSSGSEILSFVRR